MAADDFEVSLHKSDRDRPSRLQTERCLTLLAVIGCQMIRDVLCHRLVKIRGGVFEPGPLGAIDQIRSGIRYSPTTAVSAWTISSKMPVCSS